MPWTIRGFRISRLKSNVGGPFVAIMIWTPTRATLWRATGFFYGTVSSFTEESLLAMIEMIMIVAKMFALLGNFLL